MQTIRKKKITFDIKLFETCNMAKLFAWKRDLDFDLNTSNV